jgi:hypothetical protein
MCYEVVADLSWNTKRSALLYFYKVSAAFRLLFSINIINKTIIIMVKQNLLTKLLLLFALIVGSTSVAWAEDVTVISANFDNTEGWTLSGKTSSSTALGTGAGLQIASGKGLGTATSPTFSNLVGTSATLEFDHISSGSAARTLTVTGNNCKVNGETSISINVGTTKGHSIIAITEASTNSSITFSAATNQGTVIDNVIVYYTVVSPLETIAVTGEYPVSFYVNDEFSHVGAFVTATYENNTTADVTLKAEFSTPDMTTTGTKEVTVSYTEGEVTATAKYNITVSERPKFTVTLADDNTELQESSAGAGVILPTRDDCGIYTFAGWSENNLTEETTTAAVVPAGTYSPTKNITLYPVYSRETTELADEWVEIKNIPASGKYAICSDNYFMKAEISSNRFANGEKPTIINDKLTVAPEDKCIWEIYKVTDGTYRIKYGDKYAAAKSSNNQGQLLDDETDDNNFTVWDITYSDGFSISNKGKTNKYLRNNCEYGWAPYNSDTGLAPRLFMNQKGNVNVTCYTSNPIISITANITSAGYATFSSDKNVDFSANEGLTVYTATENETSVTLNEVSKKVPANTPVVLKGAAGSYLGAVIASADDLGANDLHISDGETATAEANIYVLANKTSNGVGFYKWAGTSSLSAGKIYLKAETSNNAPFLGFDGEGTTGISSVERGALSVEGCYTLDGRRVAQPTKGLYIVNGKKVVIK